MAKLKFSTVLYLTKLAEALETPASYNVTSHFPFLQQQQSWKYKHHDGVLALKNGESHYSFKLPENFEYDHEKFPDFEAHRQPTQGSLEFDKIATDSKTAQVHRAHPGEIYFTLQEGSKNPTVKLTHQEGTKWKGSIKKKAAKQISELAKEQQVPKEVEKQAMLRQLLRKDTFLATGVKL